MRKHIFKILLILPLLMPAEASREEKIFTAVSHADTPTDETPNVSLFDSSKANITTGFDDIIGVHPLMNEHYCFSGKFCWKTDREFRTLSGKQTLVIITKQTYNTDNGITYTYSTFQSEPISVTFPVYLNTGIKK